MKFALYSYSIQIHLELYTTSDKTVFCTLCVIFLAKNDFGFDKIANFNFCELPVHKI